MEEQRAVRAVLGIDAAWTLAQPSGVALVVERPEGWQLIAVASSYLDFQALADRSRTIQSHPSGSSPDASQLIAAAAALCWRPVDLVAIDIPLAQSPILGRRIADDAVSKAYGGRKCATHSPNASRPGRISDDLREGFERAGYPLRTRMVEPPGLIEVYPHPALVELAGAAERLPYKAAKVRRYWPAAAPSVRRARLYGTWRLIIDREHDRVLRRCQIKPDDGGGRRGGRRVKMPFPGAPEARRTRLIRIGLPQPAVEHYHPRLTGSYASRGAKVKN
jgi:hypothetical protein